MHTPLACPLFLSAENVTVCVLGVLVYRVQVHPDANSVIECCPAVSAQR